jgi:hypothetical protein
MPNNLFEPRLQRPWRSISMFGSIELIDSQLSIENTAFEFLLGETQAGSVGGSSFR